MVVEENQGFYRTYRRHFVSVLHEVIVHSTFLPKCPNDSRMSLECFECKKYLTGCVIHDVTRHWKWVKYQKLHFSHQNLVHCTILPKWLVMTSQWWHDSRTSLECFESQKYLPFTSLWRHQPMKKGQFSDISEFFSNLTLLVALKIPRLIPRYHCNYCRWGNWSKWGSNGAQD